MIEIKLSTLQKAEKIIQVKATSKRKGHTRKIKIATEPDVEVIRDYKIGVVKTENWVKEHKERITDIEVVNNFTIKDYKDINKVLHGREPDHLSRDEVEDKISVISGFLRDAPKFGGTVYRGVGFDLNVTRKKDRYDKFMIDIRNNDTITLPGFTSTSHNKKIATNFGLRGGTEHSVNIVLEIKSKRGVILDGVTKFPNEQEILFDKGSEFKVIKVENIDGIDHIRLEEI